MAAGISEFPISLENGQIPMHVQTAIYVIELFTGNIFKIKDNILTVDGIGKWLEYKNGPKKSGLMKL